MAPEALGRCGRVLGRGKNSAPYKGKNNEHKKAPPKNISGGLGLLARVLPVLGGVCFALLGGVCFEPVKCLRFWVGWLKGDCWDLCTVSPPLPCNGLQ